MENFLALIIVVKEVADSTKVSGKFDFTFLTILLRFLNGFAIQAFNFFNRVSVDLMIFLWVHLVLIFYFIVTKSACEEFFTSWTFLGASSFVMFAAKLGIVRCFFFFCFLNCILAF